MIGYNPEANTTNSYYDRQGICNTQANGKPMKSCKANKKAKGGREGGDPRKGNRKRQVSAFVGSGFYQPFDRYGEMNIRKIK
jgi:hypothetical protein